jgi:hypothetical protein
MQFTHHQGNTATRGYLFFANLSSFSIEDSSYITNLVSNETWEKLSWFVNYFIIIIIIIIIITIILFCLVGF